jgi:ribosome biogenesis GTPase
MQLIDLGWNSYFEEKFEPYKNKNYIPMRIGREDKQRYLLLGEAGEFIGEISGRYRHEASERGELPVTGDWAAVSILPDDNKAIIHATLPRRSGFKRKVAGRTTMEQVVAANIDALFIVCGLDGNFNMRRIERYLSLSWECGATPVVILNKADLNDDVEARVLEVKSVAIGVDVHAVSAATGIGMDVFKRHITRGKSAAFIGSSGVGKSTMINYLLGTERLKVAVVSELGDRGRHTTTRRELILLPQGGIVIDTPGMRELQLWGDDEGLDRVFDDIMELAKGCRFSDCRHQSEPGCAVKAAIAEGTLGEERLRNFLKLRKELRYLALRQEKKASAIEKDRWKKIRQRQKIMKKNERTG